MSHQHPQNLDILKLLPPLNELSDLVEQNEKKYQTAEPFPHIYFDNFLPEIVAQQMLDVFPDPTSVFWNRFRDDQQWEKYAAEQELKIPPTIRNVLYALNSQTFLSFLEKLTGIPDLISDPYFRGGGLHQTLPQGKLDVHVDFNRHRKFGLERRVNLLLYLNQNWEEDFGGHLELWSRDGQQSVKNILPLFNRCAIFSTSEDSYHGHPHPLSCPEDRSRKSIALYYYSNSNVYSNAESKHTTLFIEGPIKKTWKQKLIRKSKSVAREILPPFVQKIIKKAA